MLATSYAASFPKFPSVPGISIHILLMERSRAE